MKLLIVLFATLAVASAGFGDLKWFSFPLFAPVTTTTKAPTTTTKAPTTTTKAPTTTTKAPTTTTTTKAPPPEFPAAEGELSSDIMKQLEDMFKFYPELAERKDEIVNQEPPVALTPLDGSFDSLPQEVKDLITRLKEYVGSLPPGAPIDFNAIV